MGQTQCTSSTFLLFSYISYLPSIFRLYFFFKDLLNFYLFSFFKLGRKSIRKNTTKHFIKLNKNLFSILFANIWSACLLRSGNLDSLFLTHKMHLIFLIYYWLESTKLAGKYRYSVIKLEPSVWQLQLCLNRVMQEHNGSQPSSKPASE